MIVNRHLRLLVGAALAALVIAAPASAAPPANDTFAGAKTIASLPFSDMLDTTQATTDATDMEANKNCGAPATEASVWYKFTPSSDMTVGVDVSQSDYDAGVIVVTGSPGNLTLVSCNPAADAFSATAGTTYYIMAFDDTFGGTTGGNLQIDVSEVVPPEAHISLDGATINPHTDAVTASGTFTCANASDVTAIDVAVRQNVGRFTITGFNNGSADPCDGQPHPWSVDVTGDDGRFGGGKATIDAFLIACGPFDCATDEVTQTVQLHRH